MFAKDPKYIDSQIILLMLSRLYQKPECIFDWNVKISSEFDSIDGYVSFLVTV